MERKNTILLTVIAVATLLVAVVGATFAYFTATTTSTGQGGSTTGNTAASANGATLTLSPTATPFVRQLDYPGGFAYVGAKVVATKAESSDTNEYDLTYRVTYSISNSTKTELSYTLYKSSSEITNAKNCSLQQLTNADDSSIPAGETRSKYTCTGENTYGTKIASGKVAASTDGAAVTVTQTNETTDKQPSQELSTNTNTTTYYYLVIDYPNSDTVDQSDDQGKAINASITGVDNLSSVKQTA
ncbi:MAG: SipW-dependent-type signal peptide-containing protein [Ruminococcus sp.]|nr:SipW-dependent-type signal peptide-containing protein [Ruminococcus sp.]